MNTTRTDAYKDVQMDVFSGGVVDSEMLDYVPDILDALKAVATIRELIDKLPDLEVRGLLEKWQATFTAVDIELSYDYAPYQYQDTVENRTVQVANITEGIRSGNIEYVNDFPNAIIAEEAREGKGREIDDSEAVQAVRKAKELLGKLAEKKSHKEI